MSADHLIDTEKFEARLWKMADSLRANSNLASNEYFLPILGLIFLRHATSCFREAQAAIEADKKAGKMPNRSLVAADFQKRRALMLPQELMQLPADELIVLKAGTPPIRGRKIAYHRERAFNARVIPAPQTPARAAAHVSADALDESAVLRSGVPASDQGSACADCTSRTPALRSAFRSTRAVMASPCRKGRT